MCLSMKRYSEAGFKLVKEERKGKKPENVASCQRVSYSSLGQLAETK